MIDTTYLWINESISISIEHSQMEIYRNKFVQYITDGCLVITGTGGYRIGTPGNGNMMRVYEMISLAGYVVGDQTSFMMELARQVGPSNEHLLNWDTIGHQLFKLLASDRMVVRAIKDYVAATQRERREEIMFAQGRVQHQLRMRYDDDCGIEPQFIIPDANPHQLYFIVGSELRYIPEVRGWIRDGSDVTIGNISNGVDLSVASKEDESDEE
jgi:hypothetical protein